LAFGLAALGAWRRPHAARYVLTGFALSLALHAHPSAVLLAPAAIAATAAAPRARFELVQRHAALALGFVLPFLPMLVAEAREGWPALARSGEYFASTDLAARIARIPVVIAGSWGAPVVLVRDFLLPDVRFVRAAWVGGIAAVGLLALVGVARASIRRNRLPPVLAAIAIATTGASALLRETVAFYFVLPLLPLVAGSVALALREATTRHRDLLVGAVGMFALIANAAVLMHRTAQAAHGEQWLPRASLADVARWPAADPVPLDYLPVASADRVWVPLLCGASAPAALHGDIAAQFELAQALPLVLGCRDRAPLPAIGGPGAPRVAGLPVGLMRRAALAVPAHAHGHALLEAITPLHPPRGARLGLHEAYPPHPFEYALDERIALEARSGASSRLAITELNPAFVATAEPRVRANGASLVPIARSAGTRIYYCSTCTAPVEWRIELASGKLGWIDVFLVDAPLESAPAGL
ncbi:MAG TPA: hypothetical protein VND91_08990, partial [Candidatus Saccharimonadia bacterium]|nr:hypothetical protein [Candidatus Saccharimonadia bacterium]